MRAWLVLVCLVVACGKGNEDDPDGPSGPAVYIRGDVFPKLILEIDSVPGFEPRTSVETSLLNGLALVLDKPGGITAVRDDALVSKGADHAWTSSELNALAGQSEDLPLDTQTARMHVLFVDGHYEADSGTSKVLGIAFGGRNLVMFKQTIETLCQDSPLLIRERVCAAAEQGVWTHEIGHLLGLVDNGLDMVENHRDPDTSHGAHDVSDDCIMYWAFEGENVVALFRDRILGGNDDDMGFDQACLADIAALRNRPADQ